MLELAISTVIAGVNTPYLLTGQKVILKEWSFDCGPARYCLVYEVTGEHVGLITLWHGAGSRAAASMARIWPRREARS